LADDRCRVFPRRSIVGALPHPSLRVTGIAARGSKCFSFGCLWSLWRVAVPRNRPNEKRVPSENRGCRGHGAPYPLGPSGGPLSLTRRGGRRRTRSIWLAGEGHRRFQGQRAAPRRPLVWRSRSSQPSVPRWLRTGVANAIIRCCLSVCGSRAPGSLAIRLSGRPFGPSGRRDPRCLRSQFDTLAALTGKA